MDDADRLERSLGGQYFSDLPYSFYTKTEYWLDSPALAANKLGVCLMVMAVAWVWANHATAHRWSFFRQIGTTSLLVYWVHIELVYGRWFGFWKESMTFPQVVLFSIALIAAMTILSIIRKRGRFIGPFPRATAVPAPRSVQAD